MTYLPAYILLVVFALTPRQSECGYNVGLTRSSEQNSLANIVLQKLVDANIFDVQVAKKLLTTFGFSGIGGFANLQGSTAYTSSQFVNITYSANASGVGNFSQALSQLLASTSTCTTDRQMGFIQATLKLALDSKVIDAKTAVSISAGYNVGITVEVENNGGQECLQRQYDFQRLCVTQYKGIADGARCFFLTDTLTNWTLAWESCRNAGGVLAQIQTSSEYSALKNLPQAAQGVEPLVWAAGTRPREVALARDCKSFADATYWYEDANTFEPQMVFNNTFVRTNDCAKTPWIFDQLRRNCAGYLRNPYYSFHYAECSFKTFALCQVSSDAQEYVLVRDVCSIETPITTAPGSSHKDCINECRRRRWCRSFNFLNNNSICQLFTWWALDNPKTSSANETCAHYSYVA